jgi:hypothetical protein
MSSLAGNGGVDVDVETNEGSKANIGSGEGGLPEANNLVFIRGQHRRVVSTDSVNKKATLETNFVFDGTGYISSPYFGFTSHDIERGKSVVGVHKTSFLEELKAGYTITPYNQSTYQVQAVQSDVSLQIDSPIDQTFADIEYQIGNYRCDGTISYPDTASTVLHGSWAPSATKFTSQVKNGYTISTGSSEHGEATVAQVVNDQKLALSAKFVRTFESEPIYVVYGPRGKGLVSASAGTSKIHGSDPCKVGHPCHQPTKFLKELRVGDVISINNGTHELDRTVSVIEDDAHMQLSECLTPNAHYNDAGQYCVGMGDDFSEGKLPTTSRFKIKTFKAEPYTYQKQAAGKVISSYVGVSSRAAISVSVDQASMGGDAVSLTHKIGRGYAIVVRTQAQTASSPPVYERRVVKKVTSQNTLIVDRKFSRSFDSTVDGASDFHFDSCPSATSENGLARRENGPGVISSTGVSQVYNNNRFTEVDSTDAQFQTNLAVGYYIVLSSTGVKRMVTKIVTDTRVHIEAPFHSYTNGAPVSFTNHAYQYEVANGYDKNGAVVANDRYDVWEDIGSDYFLSWKPQQNTGGSNSRQQGPISDARQLFSHQRMSSVTSSGASVLSQDPYLLSAPVCYNNGRCVDKNSHSLVGIEKVIQNADGSVRKGEIMSSSTGNAIHDLVAVGDTLPFYQDCKPSCTITATANGISETREVVGTVTAHNATHLYTTLPFTYNGTSHQSQYANQAVPGFVPAGTTAYSTFPDVEFRVRYVTATGYAHWCPNGQAGGADCDSKTLTGSSKETKTKFHSETSPQWTITLPCDGTGAAADAENRTISQVHSDTQLTVHDAFTTNRNKVNYCIGSIPALGRVTSPQGHVKVYGDSDSRFLEQLKVQYMVTIGGLDRTITSIQSNSEMTVNRPFTNGVNQKSAMFFSRKVGTGEVSTSAGSTDVRGTTDVTQTKFNEEISVGDMIFLGKHYRMVTEVLTATKLKVDLPFTLMTNTISGQTHGHYKSSLNYESCITYDIGDYVNASTYETKHVYVEDACEIKLGCCGHKLSGQVQPDRLAFFKVRPRHSNVNIKVVATTIEDNIDLIAKKDSVPSTSSYDYTSVRESNPWALTIPAGDITCGDSYVGYNVSTTLGVQAHINAPSHGTVDDTKTLDADAVSLTGVETYAPSNCSFFYIAVRGDNRYPQKTGASEYTLIVYEEFDFSDFICGDAATDTSMGDAGKDSCHHLGLSAVEDAAFVLNEEDSRAVARLTPSSNMRKGAMYHSQKVHIQHGFEFVASVRISHFTVGCNHITNPSGFCGGADGIAIIIHEDLDGDKDIGCYGSGLGYGTVVNSDQGSDWARSRCLTYSSAAASDKCDSGLAAGTVDGDITNVPNALHQDNGTFTDACALMALCNPLDNGCGGTCGMPSCQRAIGRVVAIEFDTWNNLKLHDPKQGVSRWYVNATEFVGYNDNHVAIFSSDSVYGTSTDHASPNHFGATPSIPNIADGRNHTIKVKYYHAEPRYIRSNRKGRGVPHETAVATNGDCKDNTGATDSANRNLAPDACYPQSLTNVNPGQLVVFVDDMHKPALMVKISLMPGDGTGQSCHDNDIDRCVLDSQGNAYLGFTAATGGERIGVTMDPNGVTSTLRQVPDPTDWNKAVEDASLKIGGAQKHEVLSMKFCQHHGCAEVGGNMMVSK